jgi:hypothetical protein
MIRFERPNKDRRGDIVFPALMAYWFAYYTYRLDRIRLHPNSLDSVLAIFFGALTGIGWLWFTPPRLKELRLSRLWVAPLALPFLIAVVALWNNWRIAGWVFLILGVAAQGTLVFMVRPETSDQETLNSIGPGGEL